MATALIDLPSGDYVYDSHGTEAVIIVPETIRAGFKLALLDIQRDESVYKYGYVIGLATADIKQGRCVHVHNLISSR